MRRIIIPGFGGGIANSIFDPLEKQTFQDAKNLDVFSQQKVLTPHVKMDVQVTDPAMSSAKIAGVLKASNGTVYFIGDSGTSNQLKCWKGTLNTGTMTLSNLAGGAAVGGSNTAPIYSGGYEADSFNNPFAMVEANGYVLFWTGAQLSRFDLATETYSADPYTWSHGGTNKGALFYHEGLQKLFIAVDNKMYSLASTDISGTTDPTLVLTVDPKYVIRSFCERGRFVAVGVQDKKDTTTSKVFISDGSSTTVDDSLDVGDTGLQAIRNVNGIIHVLCTSVLSGFGGNYVRVYLISGDSPVLGDELQLNSGTETTQGRLIAPITDSAVRVVGDRIYFAFKGFTQNYDNYIGITNGIYAYGKFEANQPRILTIDRTTTTTATNYSFSCLQIIDGGLLTTFSNGTNYYLEHIFHNTTLGNISTSGVFETNAFLLNGADPGKIKRIIINHKPIPTSTGFTVSVKHYGHYPWGTSTPSEDSYTALTTAQGTGSSTGKTQSTDNATYTIIEDPNVFKTARYAQLKISVDEALSTSTSGPSIIFPIIVEVE